MRALLRDVRVKLGSALMALQRGFNLGMPLSRPMPMVRMASTSFGCGVSRVTIGCSITERQSPESWYRGLFEEDVGYT